LRTLRQETYFTFSYQQPAGDLSMSAPNQEQLYYCSISGNESGPFNAEQLKQLVREGHLRGTDSVRREQSMTWHSAVNIRGLFSGEQTKPEEYFYYDSQTAERKGPYNKLELEIFYRSGVITDNTVIENQAGQTTEWKNPKSVPTPIPPKRDDFEDTFTPMPLKQDDDDNFTPPIPPWNRKQDDDDATVSTSAPVGGFLDIKFTRFITNWVIPIHWCLAIALAIGTAFINPILLFFIIEAVFHGLPFIDNEKLFVNAVAFAFALFVLQIPMLLFWLLNVRMLLEAAMVFFRMEKHLRKMSSGD
jgi:hypothetical protein